ncbi:hypothetical protein V5O48_007445 [Marasmius crinis-equi]|uniref:Uncharacterized protein n=1 Tax=Marasmius crinis-equi TaxID=585013 RepID=A0ABR3FGP1_9AGAR
MNSLKVTHNHPLVAADLAASALRTCKQQLREITPAQLLRKTGYFLHTLFLFTRSDWKTMMFPVSTFALVAGPIASIYRYPIVLFWIWTTLLQFNCANQAYSGDEDSVNKPWRPVPARRITPESTARLRWIMFCFNVCFSSYLGRSLLYTTIFLTCAEYLYNEMKFSENPLLKNMCNVLGYGGFETGATLIACEYNRGPIYELDTDILSLAPHLSLDEVAIRALTLSCALIFTTIHAQDFPDREGDKLAGRKTLPIVWPEASRVYIAAVLVAWSIALSLLWGLGLICCTVFIAAGSFIAWRFYTKREVESDEKTYLIYNIWLLCAVVLPINSRLDVLSF